MNHGGKEKPDFPPPEPKKGAIVVPKGTKVDLTKKDEELVKKVVEKETRVDDTPVPPKPKEKVVTLDDPTIYARLVRIERMLEWLIVQRVTDDQQLIKQPNIADIFKEIASKMAEEKKKKEDEVQTPT